VAQKIASKTLKLVGSVLKLDSEIRDMRRAWILSFNA
jgi:hypothetical protein